MRSRCYFATAWYCPQPWQGIVAVQVLHGVCYAFFFATVYIFVDAYFPKDIRSSAQGLFNLQILGVGALLAFSICPWLMQSVYTKGNLVDFKGLFLVPLAAASIAAIALALFFHPPKDTAATAGGASSAPH